MYVTRSMLLHSSIGMDNFIRRELAIAFALGMDKAAIDVMGTNDAPLGILNLILFIPTSDKDLILMICCNI